MRQTIFIIRIILLLTSIYTTLPVYSQEIDWQHSKNWKLYDIHDDAAFSYRADTLKNFKSIVLEKDSMQDYLANVYEWPKEKYSMWMGLYIASCELQDHSLRMVIISRYGGFFYDPTIKRYYELPEQIRNGWMAYLNDKEEKLNK